jgi:hypothetical protein
VQAQQSVAFATLSGVAEDANGAAIGGATIAVTNLEQNQTRTITSDAQGRFRFLYLPVGNYQLKAERAGFTTIERQLTLTLGQSLELPIRMAVGGVTDKVNVTAEAALVETVRTQLAETVLPQEIENLSLNGRNYLDLAALTPGVTRANPVANQRFAETSAVPGTQISVAGQRNINNGFVLDGLSANDDAADLPGTFFSQEVIREFQVISSGGIAEFGRFGGHRQRRHAIRHERLAWARLRLFAESETRCAQPARPGQRSTDAGTIWLEPGRPHQARSHFSIFQLRADAAE